MILLASGILHNILVIYTVFCHMMVILEQKACLSKEIIIIIRGFFGFVFVFFHEWNYTPLQMVPVELRKNGT